jgi:hypothetical protein
MNKKTNKTNKPLFDFQTLISILIEMQKLNESEINNVSLYKIDKSLLAKSKSDLQAVINYISKRQQLDKIFQPKFLCEITQPHIKAQFKQKLKLMRDKYVKDILQYMINSDTYNPLIKAFMLKCYNLLNPKGTISKKFAPSKT